MSKRLYSARVNPKQFTVNGIYWKFKHLYLLFRGKGYFNEKLGITPRYIPDAAEHEAALELNFNPFPVDKLKEEYLTEENIFDLIEFFHDRVSKPGPIVQMETETGWQYDDYESYDGNAGRVEYRKRVNSFLCDYGEGFELKENGEILALGDNGLRAILDAPIIPFDEEHVDSKVRAAILKWRNRQLSLAERKAAIRDMADVFEWLKTKSGLHKIVEKDDTALIFQLVNKFHIRHSRPDQKNNYDRNIWYSWMFHFYLATYHAAIRMLVKQ